MEINGFSTLRGTSFNFETIVKTVLFLKCTTWYHLNVKSGIACFYDLYFTFNKTCLKYNINVNLTKRSQNCPTIKGTCTLYNIICFRNLTLFMVLVFKTKKKWFCTIIKFCIKCVDVYGKPFMTDKCIFAHHRNIFWHIEVCKSNKHLHFTFVILDGIWLHRKRRLFNYFDPFFHHMSSYASFAYTVCQRRKNSSCTCILDKKIIWSKQVWQEGAG